MPASKVARVTPEPIALQKARSLAGYMYGAPDVAQTFVTLTDREAWEFLKWYRTQLMERQHFDRELKKARALRDPWPVLEGMVLCGFQITKAEYQDAH